MNGWQKSPATQAFVSCLSAERALHLLGTPPPVFETPDWGDLPDERITPRLLGKAVAYN